MTAVKSQHDRAMDLAEEATLAKIRGDTAEAARLFRLAFEHEREAAGLCSGQLDFEPTRSVLHRSAASLAVECGEGREAERLIAAALAGNPPEEIANELRDLLEQVYFQKHLDLRGITLGLEEIQFSIAGKGIGFGIAPSEEYVERVQAFEKMVYRTAERKLGINYRERGSPERDVRENFEVFVTVPRAASLAVTMKIGRKKEQMLLQFEKQVEVEDVINDIIDCLEGLNQGRREVVEEHIGDKAYFNNFVALARRIAPDGEAVNLVGLSVYREGKKRDVSLTKTTADINRKTHATVDPRLVLPSLPAMVDESQPSLVEVWGKLRYADSTSGETGKIKLIDDEGAEHTVIVPEGMMSDIVRPLWDFQVHVIGSRIDDMILLEQIRRRARRRGQSSPTR